MRVLLVLLAFLSQSCFSARYVAQAARGQLGMAASSRRIPDVVKDPETPERERRLLATVPRIKAYAQRQGLTPTRSYERYADLGRPAAVWVVQACAPLSFEVKRWSFPIVGSVPYLGFFAEDDARRYARGLASEGLDVDIRGASAFSTLGWFRDPVLSTMLGSGDEALGDLVNVILHESVHATVYVPDQSAFDESLASFVADRMTPAALEALLGQAARETAAWRAALESGRERAAVLHDAYARLDAIYRSARPESEKRDEKARILAEAERQLHLARALNNAALAGHRTYETGTAGFEALLEACDASWPRLLAAARTLTPGDFAHTQQEDFEGVVGRLAARCQRPDAGLHGS